MPTNCPHPKDKLLSEPIIITPGMAIRIYCGACGTTINVERDWDDELRKLMRAIEALR